MSLTSKIKSAWNKAITSPWSYVTLAAFSFGGFTNAQVQNPQDANLHGKVTSGLTTQGIPQAEVRYISTNPQTVLTNSAGEYLFNITDVEDEYTQIESGIETMTNNGFAALNITTESVDIAKIIIYDVNGQRVKEYTQELEPGKNSIKIPTNDLAQTVYFTTIQTRNSVTAQKIVKTGEEINWGKISTTKKVDNTSQSLNKSLEDITYTLQFRDLTEQHYPYIVMDPQTLQQDQEYSTPLLPKKDLDIPFINPRNNEQVNTTKGLLFFEAGVDVLLYVAYKPLARPLLTHLNIADLPAQYSEQDVRNATLEMLTATNLPVDTMLWKETENYIRPQDSESSTIGYKFLDSSVMGQDEFIVNYIVSNERKITSLEFKFNKDLIESNQIGNFIKYAWWWGVVGERVPKEGYFSNDPRDSIDTMTLDENIVYSTLFQYEDRPTWISDENIPENNLAKSSNNITKEELSQKLTEQSKSYSISFRINSDNKYEMIRTQLENQQMYDQMKNELEQKDVRFK